MAIDIDFGKLSLKDALDLAIFVEDEAMERYNEFTDQMLTHHTEDSAHFFRFMAGNEKKHGDELRARRQELFGSAPRAVDRSMIYDVEAPTYDRARAFMSVHQALRVALDAEVKAWRFFDSALPTIKDPEVKALFAELREEEVEHQDLVKAEMAKLPPEKDIDPDDFVDPPVGQ
jgi:rubrerythrin